MSEKKYTEDNTNGMRDMIINIPSLGIQAKKCSKAIELIRENQFVFYNPKSYDTVEKVKSTLED